MSATDSPAAASATRPRRLAAHPYSRPRLCVVFARDMAAMRHFYAEVMRFPRGREIGDIWFEYPRRFVDPGADPQGRDFP